MNVDEGHCCECVSDNFVVLNMDCVSERLNHTGKHELHIMFFTLIAREYSHAKKMCTQTCILVNTNPVKRT